MTLTTKTLRTVTVLGATMLAVLALGGTAFAASTVTPTLSVLINPPVPQADILDTDQMHMDTAPAGGCVDYSTVVDGTFAAATDMRMWMSLDYSSAYRENLVHAASIMVARANAHLAIWLYRWNGSSWVWAGQSRFRYPTTAWPYWSRPAGDPTPTNAPNFWVKSNTGHYTIRVAIVSSTGAILDSGYVAAFGHADLTAVGPTRYCTS